MIDGNDKHALPENIEIIYWSREKSDAFEHAEEAGYLTHLIVKCDGESYPIQFCEIKRLSADMELGARLGYKYMADPGLVIVEKITEAVVTRIVQELHQAGFFRNFVPLSDEDLAGASLGRWPPARQ